MPETKEISFLKKILISIKDFEKYPELAAQKGIKVFIYILKLMAIFTAVVAALSTYSFIKQVNDATKYMKDEMPNFTFSDGKLNLESEDKIQIKNDEAIIDNILIDTRDLSQNQIEEYNNEIKKSLNGILILKDKVILKTGVSSSGMIQYSYKEMSDRYDIKTLEKQDIINYLSGNNLILMSVGVFIATYIYMFMVYLLSVLIDAIILGALGCITALILRLRLRYSAMVKIAIHSLTLPIILNMIYIVVKTITGFELKYFEIMYIAISYIYIIASILMIKSDVIKKGQELAKIIEEQEKVKIELELKKEEEEKQKSEEEKRRQKEKERKQKKEEEQEEGKIGKEPQGENA